MGKWLFRIWCATVLLALSQWSVAQSVTTLTFTGKSSITQEHIPLHHVVINDVTQHWEEILFYPDTILSFGGTGVEEYDKQNSVRLLQNVPNPFNGVTNFQLELPNGANVTIEIYNLNGQRISLFSDNLESGIHLFRATLTAPQTYLASAQADGARVTIKLINQGYGEKNSLEHLGCVQTKGDVILPIQDAKGNTPLPFMLGDEMRYVGYVYRNGIEYSSQPVQQREWGSNAITLLFGAFHPTVTTDSVYSVTQTAVQVDGNVVSDGDATVTTRGFCWGMNHNPTLADNYSNNGTGLGGFSNSISGLADNTTYYVRAYATNSVGTMYGNEIQFSTLPYTVPALTTDSVTNITQTTAICYGNVSYAGGHPVTNKGFCWSTNPHPTVNDEHIMAGSGLGGFSGSLTGLTVETTYYVRAYSTNSVGTAYGNEVSFTTLPAIIPPVVTTLAVTDVTSVSATCGGDITYDGGGSVTARGVCWGTSHNPTTSESHTTDGTGSGIYTSSISGLDSLTTYYVRAYATNIAGTSYGEELSFTTPVTPTVTTDLVSNITWNAAVCGGNVSSDGGATVTARGVCWSTLQNPTINNSHTTNGTGIGSFTSSITNLSASTTYYVRAYATNGAGTAYGEQTIFTTPATIPTVTTNSVTSISYFSATCGGNVSSDGGASVTARGVCWSTSQNPMISDSCTTNGMGTGSFISSITNLSPGTTYYVRAYATNSAGTAYGEQTIFTTPATIPTVTTDSVIQCTCYIGCDAVCGGNVSSDGGATVTARGICWSTLQNPTASDSYTTNGTGIGSFTSSITNLSANTTYYVRAYATNSAGTAYGEQEIFTTSAIIPTVTTYHVTDVTWCSAVCGGNVSSDGGDSVTARGVCWSVSHNPTTNDSYIVNGNDTGSFISGITELLEETTYYVRAFATNSVGTAYGNEVQLTTTPSFICGTSMITDVDGNTYHTVKLGTQCWMKENLRTTKYADNTSIPVGSVNNLSAYDAYRYSSTYGNLYNWKAVMRSSSSSSSNPSGVQGICPTGWHVPSDAEWTQLTNYVSSRSSFCCSSNTSYIAKALASTTAWSSYAATCAIGNTLNTNNATGFSALPAGDFTSSGYSGSGSICGFWSTTQYDTDTVYYRFLKYQNPDVKRAKCARYFAVSVRCVKD